jgi:Rho termination factor, N-terminal domain
VPTPQIKDERTYQALRREGNSEEKSARVANAAAASSRKKVGARGGHSPAYEEWTKKDLVQRAREIGIKGRSSMSKAELISALRNH